MGKEREGLVSIGGRNRIAVRMHGTLLQKIAEKDTHGQWRFPIRQIPYCNAGPMQQQQRQ